MRVAIASLRSREPWRTDFGLQSNGLLDLFFAASIFTKGR